MFGIKDPTVSLTFINGVFEKHSIIIDDEETTLTEIEFDYLKKNYDFEMIHHAPYGINGSNVKEFYELKLKEKNQ